MGAVGFDLEIPSHGRMPGTLGELPFSVARAQRKAKRNFQEHARRRAVAQMLPFHIARLPVQDGGTG
jgi:hypothetical protein